MRYSYALFLVSEACSPATLYLAPRIRSAKAELRGRILRVILKTLLALPAMSFAKRPRMAVLHKKSVAGGTR